MTAGATYTPIATTTLGSDQASVTFSSISGSYTDLICIVNGALTTADNTYMDFNGDTATNYSQTYLRGNGSTATSGGVSGNNYIVNDYTSYPDTTLSDYTLIVNINNYSNSTTYKTSLLRSNQAGTGVATSVGLWRSTSAITQVRFFCGGTVKWKTGSTFTLYGIVAA